jgi:hypothetical protein
MRVPILWIDTTPRGSGEGGSTRRTVRPAIPGAARKRDWPACNSERPMVSASHAATLHKRQGQLPPGSCAYNGQSTPGCRWLMWGGGGTAWGGGIVAPAPFATKGIMYVGMPPCDVLPPSAESVCAEAENWHQG